MSFQRSISKNFFLNSLVGLIPISYIAGNLILNLNVLLIIVVSIFFFRLEIFKLKLNLIDKLILILSLYIIINGIINNFFNFNFIDAPDQYVIIKKSILYLRFLILYFVIKFLIEKNILDFKFIFLCFAAACLFVSIDVLIQYFFGKDIFGYEGGDRRLGGPFGDEYIAGSYIQRFSIFLIFSLILFLFNNQTWKYQIYTLIALAILSISVLLAGNRVPLFLFILILALTFFYKKNLRIMLTIVTFLFLSSFTYLINTNKQFESHFKNFARNSNEIGNYFVDRFVFQKEKNMINVHIKELESGILTWEQNKLFGGGIRSFYFNCSNINKKDFNKYIGSCNRHPHNYYLEIATELGIFGLIIVLSIFFLTLFRSLKSLHFSILPFKERPILVPFFILFVVEIFPLKTTGSFFTTTNATFLFIILAFIVGLLEKKNFKN